MLEWKALKDISDNDGWNFSFIQERKFFITKEDAKTYKLHLKNAAKLLGMENWHFTLTKIK